MTQMLFLLEQKEINTPQEEPKLKLHQVLAPLVLLTNLTEPALQASNSPVKDALICLAWASFIGAGGYILLAAIDRYNEKNGTSDLRGKNEGLDEFILRTQGPSKARGRLRDRIRNRELREAHTLSETEEWFIEQPDNTIDDPNIKKLLRERFNNETKFKIHQYDSYYDNPDNPQIRQEALTKIKNIDNQLKRHLTPERIEKKLKK